MTVIMNGIISLFLIMFLGVFASKKNIITNDMSKGLTDIMLKITLPLLIVSSFTFTFDEIMKENITKCFIYSFMTLLICGALSYILLIPIKDKCKKSVLQFSNVFSNC